MKEDNDHLKSVIKQQSDRKELALRRKYPLPGEEIEEEVDDDVNDDYRVAPKAEVISPAQEKEEKEAERRGYSEDLGWITDEVCGVLAESPTPGLTAGDIVLVLRPVPDLAANRREYHCPRYDAAKLGLGQGRGLAADQPRSVVCAGDILRRLH